ncbi:MAG TPA: tetratricopeptide repeat protein [Tepidisphaeraceae bacterium]
MSRARRCISRVLVAASVSTAATLALPPLPLALTGCSDMVTFSQQDRDVALQAYNQGDYARAAGGFRAALRQDPRDYMSHYYLGMSTLQLGSYQQSIVAFRSCLETQNVTLAGKEDDAIRAKALDGLAQAIVKSDAADVEVNKVEQAARSAKGPAAAREFFVLAKVYRYRKLPDMALDYYNHATLDDPKNFDYAKEYGLYCEQLQQTAKAQEALRQAYGINPRDTEVIQALQRVGVVPGPSLRSKADLAQPPFPKGPIPELDIDKVKETFGLGGGSADEATPAANRTAPAAAAPRSIIPRD